MQVQIYNTLSHSNLCLSTHNLTCGRTRESKSKQTYYDEFHCFSKPSYAPATTIERGASKLSSLSHAVCLTPHFTLPWWSRILNALQLEKRHLNVFHYIFHNFITRKHGGTIKMGGHNWDIVTFSDSLSHWRWKIKKKSTFSVGITANKCTVLNPHSKWLPASQSSRQQVVEVSHRGFYTYYM